MPHRPPTHRPCRLTARDSRPSAAARGYGHRWRKYRSWFLREHPICAGCEQFAEHVDHKAAVAGPDDPLFWDQANHQGLCHECHSRKTVRHDGGFGRTPAAAAIDAAASPW